jgi:hypothetical protein
MLIFKSAFRRRAYTSVPQLVLLNACSSRYVRYQRLLPPEHARYSKKRAPKLAITSQAIQVKYHAFCKAETISDSTCLTARNYYMPSGPVTDSTCNSDARQLRSCSSDPRERTGRHVQSQTRKKETTRTPLQKYSANSIRVDEALFAWW